jgi:hypothetical protein
LIGRSAIPSSTRFRATLAKAVTKQRFITESAGPRAPPRKFQFGSNSLIGGKHVMAMAVSLDTVIVEIERTQGFHVGRSQGRTDVNAFVGPEATAVNFPPRLDGQLGQSLVRFSPNGHRAARFANGGDGCSRGMRADHHFHRLGAHSLHPGHRHPQLGWRTPPEEIRGRGGNHQKIGLKGIHTPLGLLKAKPLHMSIHD